MKYKEAYDILLKAWQGRKDAKGYPNFDDINEALDKIKELVIKETPKKVIRNIETYDWGYSHLKSVQCPCCKASLKHFPKIKTNYCRKCGQKLDWGNDNGN